MSFVLCYFRCAAVAGGDVASDFSDELVIKFVEKSNVPQNPGKCEFTKKKAFDEQ